MKTRYFLLFLLISFLLFPNRFIVSRSSNSFHNSLPEESLTEDIPKDQNSRILSKDDNIPSILRIGTLKWDERSFNYDPLKISTKGSIFFYSLIYNSLVDFDPQTGQLIPALATHWYVSDDGRHWTFILRNNVRFHDGSQFNASSIKYNYERIINPEHPFFVPRGETTFENPSFLTTIDIDNEFQVTFNFNTSNAAFLYGESSLNILSPNSFNLSNGINPIGTGPYHIDPVTSNETFLNLTRFSDYYRGIPPFAQIYYYIQYNFDTEITDQNIDFFPIGLEGLKNDDYYQLSNTSEKDSAVFYGHFNYGRPEVSNRLVRQAINYAVDRQLYIDSQFEETASSPLLNLNPLRNLVPPGNPFFKSSDGYYYDLEQANLLLDKAGYPKGSDGYRFSLTLLEYFPSHTLELLFDAIGINLTIVTENITSRFVEGDYDIAIFLTPSLPDPHSLLSASVHSSSFHNSLFPGGYQNNRVDHLITLGMQTPIRQEREFYYDKLQRVIFDDASVLSLAYGSLRYATTPVVAPYVFVNRIARICFNYSTASNVNVIHSIQGTVHGNHTIYFPVVDTVLRNLEDQPLTVNLTMDHNLRTFIPDRNIEGKFFRITLEEQNFSYSFRAYYDLDEIRGIPENQTALFQYNEKEDKWDELETLSSNTSLRYLEVELMGESALLRIERLISPITFLFVPFFSVIIIGLAGGTIYTILINIKKLNKFKGINS